MHHHLKMVLFDPWEVHKVNTEMGTLGCIQAAFSTALLSTHVRIFIYLC